MSDYDKQKNRKSLDTRDPVEIAGGERAYAGLQYAADVDAHPKRQGSLRDGIKRRIGSLRHKNGGETSP